MKKMILLLLGGLSILQPIHSLPDTPSSLNKILILHSYHAGMTWTDQITAGIQEYFEPRRTEYEFYMEYLDTKRNPEPEYLEHFIDFYRSKNQNVEFDGIIVTDNNALDFLLEERNRLFPDLPVVFCGINNYTPEMLQNHSDITGVSEYVDYEENLEIIERLHPDLKRLIIINDDKTSTAIQNKIELERIFATRTLPYQYEFWEDMALSDLFLKANNQEEGSVILLLTYTLDANRQYISYEEFIVRLNASSAVPIYGPWNFYLGRGIVGGYITSGKEQGRMAASLMDRIIGETPWEELPVITNEVIRPQFDYEQLIRWKIDLSAIPEETELLNAPPDEEWGFKLLVLSISLVLLIVSLVFLCYSLIQKYRQKTLEKQNTILEEMVRKRTEELEASNQTKNEILGIVTHDLRSPLASLQHMIYLFEEDDELTVEESRELFEKLKVHLASTGETIDTVLNWARYQMNGIRAEKQPIEPKKLLNTLYRSHEERARQKQIRLLKNEPGKITLFSDPAILQTILTNFMTNALKFSPARSTIELGCQQKGAFWEWFVRDEGTGMDEQSLNKLQNGERPKHLLGTDEETGSGIGLRLCFKLAEYIGARMVFESHPGKGTRASLIISSLES